MGGGGRLRNVFRISKREKKKIGTVGNPRLLHLFHSIGKRDRGRAQRRPRCYRLTGPSIIS